MTLRGMSSYARRNQAGYLRQLEEKWGALVKMFSLRKRAATGYTCCTLTISVLYYCIVYRLYVYYMSRAGMGDTSTGINKPLTVRVCELRVRLATCHKWGKRQKSIRGCDGFHDVSVLRLVY